MRRIIRNLNLAFKRLIDILGSGLGIIFVLPLLIVTVVLLKMFMPGPIFFKQKRVGKDGKFFNIFKIRSMKVDRLAESLHDFSKDTERFTPFGNLIRRLKIDELPQLINVFLGDMSLVGPRPTIKEQVEQYNAHQKKRLAMRPGMTGLAQVNGNISLSWNERIEYDIAYIDKFSILLDVKILMKTVLVIICGEERLKKSR